jgi:hypothetical protein
MTLFDTNGKHAAVAPKRRPSVTVHENQASALVQLANGIFDMLS